MQAGKTFSLGLDVGEGQSRSFTFLPLAGDELVFVTTSIRRPLNDGIGNDSVVVVLDTRDDEVISRQAEPRCSGLWTRRTAPDATYLITLPYQAVLHFESPELAPAPCILRIRTGETSFDPSWTGSLTEQVGSRLWGSFNLGPGGAMLTRVGSEEAIAELPYQDAASLNAAPIWRWWTTELDGSSAAPLESLDAYSDSEALEVESHPYLIFTDPETRAETLIDIADPERPTRGITSSSHRILFVRRLR